MILYFFFCEIGEYPNEFNERRCLWSIAIYKMFVDSAAVSVIIIKNYFHSQE